MKDQQKGRAALGQLRQSLTGDYFMADNLVTFGKNLGFISDKRLNRAMQMAGVDDSEMALIWRTHVVCCFAERALSLGADFVECGCYRGTTARIVCNYLDFGAHTQSYWLYDLFADNPDRPRQLEGQGDELYRRVAQRFSDIPNAKVIRGSVPDSFKQGAPESVAFLHLDLNSAAAEIGALEFLYDRVVPGGAIVLDDFGWSYYYDQFRAETDWFASRGKTVMELPTGQGIVIK